MDREAATGDFVTIREVTKSFGAFRALDGLSFGVREGGTLALLGPSGCGKTTMLRCLAGLEMPDRGYISIAGNVVFDSAAGVNLAPERRGLGVVFQSYAVWPHMSVVENVAFPLRVRGVTAAKRREQAMVMLETVGLAHLAARPATQLSGGQQQRVALARALVHKPALVLFDEALSNLDAQLREQMRLELKSLQDKLGFTAIYVTHDQGEALGLAESIILMNAGRIETSGPARQVFTSHRTAFAARFFGLNVIEAARVALPADLARELGARPFLAFQREHARMRPAGAQADTAGKVELAGTVATRAFQGLVDEYAVDLGNGQMVRLVEGEREFGPSDKVVLGIDRKNLYMLEA